MALRTLTDKAMIESLRNKNSCQQVVIESIKDTLWYHYGPLKSRDKSQLKDGNPEILFNYNMPANEMLYNVLVKLSELVKEKN